MKVTSDFDLDIFEPVLEIHPYDQIINSVIIGRVRGFKPINNVKGTENGEAVMSRALNVNMDENANGNGKVDNISKESGGARDLNANGEAQGDKVRGQMARQR